MKESPPALAGTRPRRRYQQTDPDPARGEDRPFHVRYVTTMNDVLKMMLPDVVAQPWAAADPPVPRPTKSL